MGQAASRKWVATDAPYFSRQGAGQPPTESVPPQLSIARGQEILRTQAGAVERLAGSLGASFADAVQCLLACQGHVVVSGIGKAGLVGSKLAATLASTGTPAWFLHPSEALHGDSGAVRPADWACILSYSGETEEIRRLLPVLKGLTQGIIGITRTSTSTLGQAADLVLELGDLQETCHLGLAPSTSTTAMLTLGDALALTVSQFRGLTPATFARYHPAGNLGFKLAKVEEWMRPLSHCRVAAERSSVREVLTARQHRGRRPGAILITNNQGQLVGLFTDSDLARLLETRSDALIDGPLSAVMTSHPATALQGSPLAEAMNVMEHRKFSELPVIDAYGVPQGMLDITDLLGVAAALQMDSMELESEPDAEIVPFPRRNEDTP